MFRIPHAHRPSHGQRQHAPKLTLLSGTFQFLATLIVTAAAGAPAAFITGLIASGSTALAQGLNLSSTASYLFDVGLSAGMAFILILGTPIVVAGLWQKMSKPAALRTLAYIAIQLLAIGVGLLFPPGLQGWLATWAFAGAGTVGWWVWQTRWRGTGTAPSMLAGVLRPEIHPGQIWFAVIVGRKETKTRPVIVLNPDPEAPHRWLVAYFTTQEPKYDHIDELYLQIPAGSLRGIVKDNWVSLTDPRSLKRPNFRAYTGLAPTWLYEAVCNAHGITPNPLAWTINEMSAGEGRSPLQARLMQALGVRHADDPLFEDESWANAAAILKLPISWRKPK